MGLTRGAGAVVTGAGSGFGRAVAHELARRGLAVLVSDIEEENAAETARAIERAGGKAHAMRVDVRDPEQVRGMKEKADELFGGAEVLVNNAGVAVAGPVGDVSLEDWKWQVDINLWGVIYGCHYFVPGMRTRKRGYILNVASAAGIVSAPMMAPYNVTKAGVISLSETLAGETAADGLRITALCPTFFRTDIHTRARTSKPELRGATAKLVTGAKWSAEEIARIAIDGLERGTLYVLPQTDARAMWRAKRALGSRFFATLGMLARSGLLPGSQKA